MSYFVIRGGNPLYGTVGLPAAKNAVLPLMAATVAVQGKITFVNCPHLSDITAMGELLSGLGAEVEFDRDRITVDTDNIHSGVCDRRHCGCMRSSLFLLGSVLGRVGEADIGLPGGCVIGARPIDIHLEGLRSFGVEVCEQSGHIVCSARNTHPSCFRLRYPSVGATINLLCFALFQKGNSILHNVACEPEIQDIIAFLRGCGAQIRCEGTSLYIEGGRSLHGIEYRPIGDRIVAATIMCATALCGGEVELQGIPIAYVHTLTQYLDKSTCILAKNCDTIRVRSGGKPRAFSCATGPYPAFATDMQALALAYNSASCGRSIVRESVFESRFAVARQLGKMGARIRIVGQCALIEGTCLHGAKVYSCDLRAGAALVVAALASKGQSQVDGVSLVDRGYQSLETLFSSIGADIVRI